MSEAHLDRVERLTPFRIALVRCGILASMVTLAVISWNESWCH